MAHIAVPLERAGFTVLHVDSAFVVIDMPDEPFKQTPYWTHHARSAATASCD